MSNHCKYSSVFINSANRSSGSINDFVINFADGTIKADKNTVIKVNVMDICMNRSWWSTQKPIIFSVYRNGLAYSVGEIPIGNWDINTFLEQIQLNLQGWSISYLAVMNVYQFVTPNDAYSYQIIFTNYANMFGFPSGKTGVYTYGNIY